MHELIFKNFWLKIFSLLLATTMWYVLQPTTENEPRYIQNPFRRSPVMKEFHCPITLLEAPSEKRTFNVDPPFVTLKISGDAKVLNQLDPEDIQAYVNISTVRDPEGVYRIETFAPKEVMVRSLMPTHAFIKPSK